MTQQLGEAQRAAQLNQAQLRPPKRIGEHPRESFAGVLVFDDALVLRIANSGAARILHET